LEDSFVAEHEAMLIVPVRHQKPQNLNDRRMFLKLGVKW